MLPVQLIKDTFVLQDGKSFIVYSPISNKIARVERFPKEGSKNFFFLSERGFFNNPPEYIKRDNVELWKGFQSLTLLVTRRCNLACIYCFATAKCSGESMSIEFALKTLEWFEKQLDKKTLRICFHGGGEPTFEYQLIKEVVLKANLLAQKDGKKTRFQVVTNGTASRGIMDWFIENNFGISISADGPPCIQDRNRPFQNGKGSSHIVEETIRHLVSQNHPFTIRMTFSPLDNIRMIVRYFGDLGVKSLHVEPLFPHGRNYKNVSFGADSGDSVYSPNGDEFAESFLDVMDEAQKYGIKITNSHLGHFTNWFGYFCGSACGRSMIATTDEYISGCLEVVDSRDPDFKEFCLGRFSRKKNIFVVDKDVLAKFQNRHSDVLTHCKKCFARYVCAGGCSVKSVRASGNFMNRDLPYCQFTRAIIPAIIKRIAVLSKI